MCLPFYRLYIRTLPLQQIFNIFERAQMSTVLFSKSLYIFMRNSLSKHQEVEFLQNKSDFAIRVRTSLLETTSAFQKYDMQRGYGGCFIYFKPQQDRLTFQYNNINQYRAYMIYISVKYYIHILYMKRLLQNLILIVRSG